MTKILSVTLVVILLLGGGGFVLATTADASTPVDPLYAVDLLAESVQRTFTFNDISKAELEQDILDERAEEIDTLLLEDADEAILGEAVDNLDKQRTRAEERVQVLLNDEGNYDEAALERVRSRYEEQLQNQLQNMEKVQEQYQNVGEEVKQNIEEAVQQMNNASGSGNTEQNVDDDAGDGINNRESNSDEAPGNDNPSGAANGR